MVATTSGPLSQGPPVAQATAAADGRSLPPPAGGSCMSARRTAPKPRTLPSAIAGITARPLGSTGSPASSGCLQCRHVALRFSLAVRVVVQRIASSLDRTAVRSHPAGIRRHTGRMSACDRACASGPVSRSCRNRANVQVPKLLDRQRETPVSAVGLESPPPTDHNELIRRLASTFIEMNIMPSTSRETIHRALEKTSWQVVRWWARRFSARQRPNAWSTWRLCR